MRKILQHAMNARHIYCRLRDVGISMKRARKLAMIYERLTYGLLYC